MNDAEQFKKFIDSANGVLPQPRLIALLFKAERVVIGYDPSSVDPSEEWIFPDNSSCLVDNPKSIAFEISVSL